MLHNALCERLLLICYGCSYSRLGLHFTFVLVDVLIPGVDWDCDKDAAAPQYFLYNFL